VGLKGVCLGKVSMDLIDIRLVGVVNRDDGDMEG
jgi:hypothetical protein